MRILLCFSVFSLTVGSSMVTRAQTADSLVLHLKTGKTVTVPISRIQKITFEAKTKSAPNTDKPTFALSQNYPNPVKSGTYFPVDMNIGGDVTINVYDVNGKLVRKLSVLNLSSGKNEIWWDCLDENGLKVSTGSYFYEVSHREFTLTRRMVVVK